MPDISNRDALLEEQIKQWRSYLGRRQAIASVDVAELEDHLREQIAGLTAAGLATDEAFLIAVKRMGALDALSREFALEHSDRLWKQLVTSRAGESEQGSVIQKDGVVALCCAIAAAVAVKAPLLFGVQMEHDADFYLRNVSLLILPLLTGYFAWKRRVDGAMVRWLAVVFVAAVIVANVYPFTPNGSTIALTAIHLPLALWFAVGAAYAGARWKESAGRMDFIRFSGEFFIYYVLIALGGAVLTAFLLMLFEAIGIKLEFFTKGWMIPCGAAGAVLIASWLVEAKQSVIENMAPVLTRLFTPLFTVLLVVFLGTMLWTGRGVGVDPKVLIAFDLLLVLVVALLLYSMSARQAGAPPDAFDVVRMVLIVSALMVDAFALWAIAARINEFGFTPNKVAALGENVILLVNLAWSAVLYLKFLRARGSMAALERWQTNFMPVYVGWACVVVIAFPPLFHYI